jgi:hypothetical protein
LYCAFTGNRQGDSRVTFALKRKDSNGVYYCMNTESTNSMLARASRFLSDRYAYRTQPGYLAELLAFGTVVFISFWPVVLLAHAMSMTPR